MPAETGSRALDDNDFHCLLMVITQRLPELRWLHLSWVSDSDSDNAMRTALEDVGFQLHAAVVPYGYCVLWKPFWQAVAMA